MDSELSSWTWNSMYYYYYHFPKKLYINIIIITQGLDILLKTLMACLDVKKKKENKVEGREVIQLLYLEVF